MEYKFWEDADENNTLLIIKSIHEMERFDSHWAFERNKKNIHIFKNLYTFIGAEYVSDRKSLHIKVHLSRATIFNWIPVFTAFKLIQRLPDQFDVNCIVNLKMKLSSQKSGITVSDD